MTMKEQMLNGFTEMMKGFWNNQDLDVPNLETSRKQEPCNDTISRQAAIELAMQYCPDDDGTCRKADEDIRNLLVELEDLPSAQPERKTGKWELLPLSIIPPVYKCSACGRHAVWMTTGCLVNRHEESYLSDFCPSCGADMRENK